MRALSGHRIITGCISNRLTTSHKLLSAIAVDLLGDIFEQLFDTLQMLQGLAEPCVPVAHCGRHPEVQHEDDPAGDEN